MMLGTDPLALSMASGPPFTSTSTVFGLAATTAAMSSSCTPARPISLLSKFSASVVWSLPTNNTATSAALAAATAAGIMLLSFALPTCRQVKLRNACLARAHALSRRYDLYG